MQPRLHNSMNPQNSIAIRTGEGSGHRLASAESGFNISEKMADNHLRTIDDQTACSYSYDLFDGPYGKPNEAGRYENKYEYPPLTETEWV
jgi:hypothetical protein